MSHLGSERSAMTVETTEAPLEEPQALPQWERAECTCPDWCERDHEQD